MITEPVLRAKLTTIQRRLEEDGSAKRCIGVLSEGWVGAPEVRVGDETYRVVFCPSPLAVREQMDALERADGQRLVIITDCDEQMLGADVQARVFRNRFQRIDPWQTVRDLFQATRLGPGVPQEPWLHEELVASTPEQRRALPAGTVLDVETIKDVVFRRLGLAGGRPDVRELLAWAAGPEAAGVGARPPEMRAGLRSWIEESAGKAGAAILDGVAAGYGADACALGLVFRLLAGGASALDPARREALARAERCVGHRRLHEAELAPWADAAEELLRSQLFPEHVKARQRLLERADRWLRDLGLEDAAHESRFLYAGLRQREQRFAAALEQVLRSGTADLAAVEDAADQVARHELASVERGRAIRDVVAMAVRLLRWLVSTRASASAPPAAFADAALAYAAEGSFVDQAREQTTLGYPHAELQQALRALWAAVQQRRENENRRFGELCAAWSLAPSRHDRLVPLEDVLQDVIAPLAGQSPLLLLVLDGMGLPVFHELAADLPRFGWVEVGPAVEDRGTRRYGIAVLPTLTEVSRTSLLTGRIQKGDQQLERTAFEGSQLLRVGGKAPRLFHKKTLSGDRVGVEVEVQEAIVGPAPVVGVVINAVDDWLGKGDQDAAPWEVERIKSLVTLLELAAQRGRAVVVTSDHGHVREHDSRYVAGAGSARHRAGGAPGDGELLVRGPRVCASEGQIVAPWTESLRYCSHKQNGYHGGITPQEVIVPLAVFVRAGRQDALADYAETPAGLPAWWESTSARPPLAAAPPRKAAKPKKPADAAPTLPFRGAPQERIAALLRSPLFAAQKELALRSYPGDDRVAALLEALGERGGSMTLDALAHRLDLHKVRLQGMLSALRRVLNVDGTEALEVDTRSGKAELHWRLLAVQFGLDEGER